MNLSDCVVPVIIGAVVMYGFVKKTDVYAAFTLGAHDGLKTAVKIIPQLIGLMIAVRAFSASGLMDIVCRFTAPLARLLHFPAELVPFSLLRPVSGSGSLAMATDIFRQYGTDSFLGRAVSVMMGSSETTFYTVAVYFAAVSCTDTRHTLKCALFADAVSAFVSVAVCRIFF